VQGLNVTIDYFQQELGLSRAKRTIWISLKDI
jgi:hypothetical protein